MFPKNWHRSRKQHRYRLHPDSPGPQQPAHWTSVSLLLPLEGSLNCSLKDPSSIPWLPLPNPHDSLLFWVKFWLSKSHKHNLSPWPLCLIPVHCPPFHSLSSNSHGPDCYSNTPGAWTKASTQTSPFHREFLWPLQKERNILSPHHSLPSKNS